MATLSTWAAQSDGEWIFFASCESPGHDIERCPSLSGIDNFQQQRQHAESLATPCVAFNTGGWFKSALEPRSKWTNLGAGYDHGMWVRKSALEDLEWVFLEGIFWYGYDVPDPPQPPRMMSRQLMQNRGEEPRAVCGGDVTDHDYTGRVITRQERGEEPRAVANKLGEICVAYSVTPYAARLMCAVPARTFWHRGQRTSPPSGTWVKRSILEKLRCPRE